MPNAKSDPKSLDLMLNIHTLNAGCRTREDVAQILESVARMLREFASTPKVITASILDVNGNTVGHWRLANAVEEVDRDAD